MMSKRQEPVITYTVHSRPGFVWGWFASVEHEGETYGMIGNTPTDALQRLIDGMPARIANRNNR